MQYVLEVIMNHPDNQPNPDHERFTEAAEAAARNLPGTLSKWKLHGIWPRDADTVELKEKKRSNSVGTASILHPAGEMLTERVRQ